jgi:mono/diheme cytochrome c family protein
MSNKFKLILVVVVMAVGYQIVFGMPSLSFTPPDTFSTDAKTLARGEYLYNAGGCDACHRPEGAQAPIGGYEIESPFGGVFHVPNITPDPETGIGGWTPEEFVLALKHGRSPDGSFYWPAFPYRTYKNLTDQDALDIGAYLMNTPPVNHVNLDHELPAWQSRWMLAGWNILAGTLEGNTPAVDQYSEEVQRGAYLVRALGHCGECHTPRNALGMMKLSQELSGQVGVAPQIDANGLRAYSTDDLLYFLQEGMNLDFEIVAGEMGKVIEHTHALEPADQDAYVSFLLREK